MFWHWTILGYYLHRIYSNDFEVKDSIILPTLRCLLFTLIFTLESTSELEQNWKTKLRQTWWCKFSNSQLLIHQQQYSSSIWSLHVTIHTLFWGLCPVQWFFGQSELLTQTLLGQRYVTPKLKSSQHKFYGRRHELVDHYKIYISQMSIDLFPFT